MELAGPERAIDSSGGSDADLGLPADARVLVTGAGGPAGVSVIRALQERGVPVAAADASEDAVGLRLCGASGVLPLGSGPGFTSACIALCEKIGATAVIATVVEELQALESEVASLDAAGVRHWLAPSDVVGVCADKWMFHRAVDALGIPVPSTILGDDVRAADLSDGPWIVKPRRGRGSRDVVRCGTPDEVIEAARRVPDPIVQRCLAGREFTVDALVDRAGGHVLGAVPRWRLETKSGISTLGETFDHTLVLETVERLLTGLGLTGPSNVQGFVSDRGEVHIVEVNPRFSGGLPLSLAAGSDLVGEYVRGVFGLDARSERLGFTPGVRMYRHFEEIFEGPADWEAR